MIIQSNKTILVIIIMLLSSFLNIANSQKEIVTYESFEDLERQLFIEDDTIRIINFWATWCKPCVEELPYFIDLPNTINGKSTKIHLVSLDLVKTKETKLKPFVVSNGCLDKTILLADTRAHVWIDKINKNWSGSIPATLIINRSQRVFIEDSFKSTDEIISFIQKNFIFP